MFFKTITFGDLNSRFIIFSRIRRNTRKFIHFCWGGNGSPFFILLFFIGSSPPWAMFIILNSLCFVQLFPEFSMVWIVWTLIPCRDSLQGNWFLPGIPCWIIDTLQGLILCVEIDSLPGFPVGTLIPSRDSLQRNLLLAGIPCAEYYLTYTFLIRFPAGIPCVEYYLTNNLYDKAWIPWGRFCFVQGINARNNFQY